MALMTGVVDAVLSGQLYLNRSGVAKICPYFTVLPLAPVWTDACIMNADSFDSLPSDLQEVIRSVSRDCELMVYSADTSELTMALKGIEYQGGTFTTMEPQEWAKALELVSPIREEWLERAGPLGAEILAIAEEVIANYRAFEPF